MDISGHKNLVSLQQYLDSDKKETFEKYRKMFDDEWRRRNNVSPPDTETKAEVVVKIFSPLPIWATIGEQ